MMRAIEESLKATASNTVNEFTNSNTVPQTSQDEFSKTSLPGEKKAKKILRKNTVRKCIIMEIYLINFKPSLNWIF